MNEERMADTSKAKAVFEEELGHDELNLAEFPLASLADRVGDKKKTLVFEDKIHDKGAHEYVTRKLVITASSEYGLPTALDEEVILGLIQLSKADDFSNRRVFFSRYHLIRLLGWRDEGKSYLRLEKSLKRWLTVTLFYDNAWWDKERGSWVNEHFHLLEHLILYGRPECGSISRVAEREHRYSSFTWNEIVFRSFKLSHLKQIDMNLYRGLKLPTSKRMYRFLDKRFWLSRKVVFELKYFAHEHIGLCRSYDNGELKRRLDSSIKELVHVGFIKPMDKKKRYRKMRCGEWEVIFERVSNPKGRKRATNNCKLLEDALITRGVNPTVAVRLLSSHTPKAIREKISAFDKMLGSGESVLIRNPPGFLVKSITEDFSYGCSDTVPKVGSSKNALTAKKPSEVCSRAKAKESPMAKAERDAISSYLANLSVKERKSLENEAIATAKPLALKGYKRWQGDPSNKLFLDYRNMIIQAHVRNILGLSSKKMLQKRA